MDDRLRLGVLPASVWGRCAKTAHLTPYSLMPHFSNARSVRRLAAWHIEFTPNSCRSPATGHLLIAERWLGHRSDLFNIGIQAGAILAVVLTTGSG